VLAIDQGIESGPLGLGDNPRGFGKKQLACSAHGRVRRGARPVKRPPFDSVTIRDARGTRSVSVDQFLSLPVHERIQLVLARNVDFFDGEKLVELRVALAWLRDVK
jgi:hypothetical protein